MTLFFIGEIISTDLVERTDKTTGLINQYLVANVAARLITKDGKPKLYGEDIQLPIEFKDIVERNVGKYIVIPYQYISTKDKSFLFVDDKYQPVFLDHNPLVETKHTNGKKVA